MKSCEGGEERIGQERGKKKERKRNRPVRVFLLRESSASTKWTAIRRPQQHHCSTSASFFLSCESRDAQFIQLLYFKWTRLFSHFGERSEQSVLHWTAAKVISTRERPSRGG